MYFFGSIGSCTGCWLRAAGGCRPSFAGVWDPGIPLPSGFAPSFRFVPPRPVAHAVIRINSYNKATIWDTFPAVWFCREGMP